MSTSFFDETKTYTVGERYIATSPGGICVHAIAVEKGLGIVVAEAKTGESGHVSLVQLPNESRYFIELPWK